MNLENKEIMFEKKDYKLLIGTSGFSNALLENHFRLYEGYVINAGKILALLKEMMEDRKEDMIVLSEIKRRFGWEFNGMRLHEYYFENLSRNPEMMNKDSMFLEKITEDFGSYENWEREFKGIGMMRGVGWAILYFDKKTNTLLNVWVNEHDVGHLAGAVPVIVLDVFEHAYMTDYGIKRADYIDSFFSTINWKIVEKRFEEALK